MTPEPDVVLGGRYVLVRRIAVGGMGEVWEATDQLLDRDVAVKILKEEFRTASTFLARFRAEARHAGQLSHRGIATVYDYGETEDLAFLVMELVRGRPLSDRMNEQPARSTVDKLSILAQAAEGLHAAHEAGVVHRDVKPGNLMVRDDGTVKVTDFGIARALTSAPLTEHGQMLGTPAYVSPEQATGGQVTAASDIYSLAVVAYEMFAGHAPFERDTPVALAFAHVNDPPPPLPDSVPRPVAGLIESALSKDPSLRPPSAGHFAQQLRREMASTKSVLPRTPLAPRDRESAPTIVQRSSSGSAPVRSPTLMAPVAVRRGVQRHSSVLAVAFAGLLLIMGSIIWTATRPTVTDEARAIPSGASTVSVPTEVTPTSPPPEPTTSPTITPLPITTVPITTVPITAVPIDAVPAPTVPLPSQPTPEPTRPAAAENGTNKRIGESEAVAFVVDYYERVDAGDYATTWELLSPGFRDARDLTFESYVAFWTNTRLELSDLRFVAGPGVKNSRVVFEARYDTGSGVVDETDEITLRRHPDGHLLITEQRTV